MKIHQFLSFKSRSLVKLDQFLKGKVARETGPVSERGGRPWNQTSFWI